MSAYMNSGYISQNKKKQGNQPDYRGKLNVNGQEWELAGWIKQGDKGQYLSLKVSEPYQKPAQDERRSEPGLDDDIPWN